MLGYSTLISNRLNNNNSNNNNNTCNNNEPRHAKRVTLTACVSADLDPSRYWRYSRYSHAMPDHPPCQIIPHPLAQSASAPGSRKIFYDSLFSTLRLAALNEWKTEIRLAGEAVFYYLENDENSALRFSHDFAVDFETLK